MITIVRRARAWLARLAVTLLALALLSSCSPYASVNVGAPFKVGPVYVNPSIGVGGFL